MYHNVFGHLSSGGTWPVTYLPLIMYCDILIQLKKERRLRNATARFLDMKAVDMVMKDREVEKSISNKKSDRNMMT